MKKYDLGPDLVRSAALLLVILTHSVVLSGAYSYPGTLRIDWIVTMLAFYLSHSCVPLFLILSGYLCREKLPERSYYSGVFRTLVPYVLVSVIVLADGRRADHALKLTTMIYRLLSFRAGAYDWYVEMYLGLFLLIPFINLLYARLSSRQRNVLLGCLIIMTLLPDVLTSFGTENVRADILPDYFKNCYPVTYYLTGVWLRDHREIITPRHGAILLGFGWLLPTALCISRSVRSGTYRGGGTLSTFNCLTVGICAVGLFILLVQIQTCRIPGVRTIVREIANASLASYLFSSLLDHYLYVELTLPFLAMTLIIFVCSGLVGAMISRLSAPLIRPCVRCYDAVSLKLQKKIPAV